MFLFHSVIHSGRRRQFVALNSDQWDVCRVVRTASGIMAHARLRLSASTLPHSPLSPVVCVWPVCLASSCAVKYWESFWRSLAREHRWSSKASRCQNISVIINFVAQRRSGWVIDLSLLPVVFMESSEDFSCVYCFGIQFMCGGNDILLGCKTKWKAIAN